MPLFNRNGWSNIEMGVFKLKIRKPKQILIRNLEKTKI